MRPHLVVGRIFGIEIGLHTSWLVLAALVVSSLAGHFSATSPEWGPRLIWTTAGVTAMLVFVSLVLHELAHAAVARARGLPVPSITLFALGGVAQIKQETADPRTEFVMGLAGPAMSGFLAAAALGAAHALNPDGAPRPATELLAWVGAINGALALFNLIPGFPLDGGRLLRAAIWGWTGDFMKATRLASRAGQAVACAFLAIGGIRVLGGAGLGGLWLALLGWFLLEASTMTFLQAEMRSLLNGVSVSDLMSRGAPRVGREMPLYVFIQTYLLRGDAPCFLVMDGERAAGLVSAREAASMPRDRWTDASVGDCMKPLEKIAELTPETPAAEALELMARDGTFHLPVAVNGQIEGVVSRNQLVQALSTRRML